MEFQLHSLSLSDGPLLQELAAKVVIDDMKSHSPEISIDGLVSALTFFKHEFNSSNQLIRECAAAVMSKLASTSARSVLIGFGCLPILVETLESSSVHTLTSSDSAIAHAADEMLSLFKHDTTRPAAATEGVVSALVKIIGRLGANADGAIARGAGACCSNGKVQVAVTAALHALAKDSAHRQALVAAGGVKGLVAALKSDRLVSGAKDLAERALYELAEDPTTTAAVIDQGGTEHCIEVLASLLPGIDTEVLCWRRLDDHRACTEREGCHDGVRRNNDSYTEPKWRHDDPTVVSAMMAAKIVNFSSALPEGRVRLINSSHGLIVLKNIFKISSMLDGRPADIVFDQLAVTMLRLSQGQESRDVVELPRRLQAKVDAGMNVQKLQQELRRMNHIKFPYKVVLLAGYYSD